MPFRISRINLQDIILLHLGGPIPFTTLRLATSTLQASPWVWARPSLCQHQRALFLPVTVPMRLLPVTVSMDTIRWPRSSRTQIHLVSSSSSIIITITRHSLLTIFRSIQHTMKIFSPPNLQRWKSLCRLISRCKNIHQQRRSVHRLLKLPCDMLPCQRLPTSMFQFNFQSCKHF
jgi:hypothetical protein